MKKVKILFKFLIILVPCSALIYGLYFFFLTSLWSIQKNTCNPREELNSEAYLYFSADGPQEKNLNYVSIQRLNHLVKLYKPHQKVFLNGHAEGNPNTVAQARQYLISHKIKNDQIFDEQKSKNTYENLIYGLELIQAQNIKNLTLISSPYHMDRILKYYLKISKIKNYSFNLSWSSYDPQIDHQNKRLQFMQINHEVLARIRDYFKHDLPLTSGLCRY